MLIVFRVICNPAIGMGHVYRSKTIAYLLKEHNIKFVTDLNSEFHAKKLLSDEYELIVSHENEIVDEILGIKPDLVINDILFTDVDDVLPLKEKGILVINFEDLGKGAGHTDITINELFETPILIDKNILWGHEYFFVREEFDNVRAHRHAGTVTSVLITFGGIDALDCTSKAFLAINDFCKKNKIKINIVTGPGYRKYQNLKALIGNYEHVFLSHATGIISSIMENSDLAICSNGRTVYELAHMNIPTIAIPQHEREGTHEFASKKTGFIVLNNSEPGSIAMQSDIYNAFELLFRDNQYRKQLFDNMSNYNFSGNRGKIRDLINSLLNSKRL